MDVVEAAGPDVLFLGDDWLAISLDAGGFSDDDNSSLFLPIPLPPPPLPLLLLLFPDSTRSVSTGLFTSAGIGIPPGTGPPFLNSGGGSTAVPCLSLT